MKRIWYAEAYEAVEPDRSELGADLDALDVDGVDAGDLPASVGSSSGKGVTRGVAKRDNVLSVN